MQSLIGLATLPWDHEHRVSLHLIRNLTLTLRSSMKIKIRIKSKKASAKSETGAKFMESLLGLRPCVGTMNPSESPSTALRAPSPPLGEKDGIRGSGFMESMKKSDSACSRHWRPVKSPFSPARFATPSGTPGDHSPAVCILVFSAQDQDARTGRDTTPRCYRR